MLRRGYPFRKYTVTNKVTLKLTPVNQPKAMTKGHSPMQTPPGEPVQAPFSLSPGTATDAAEMARLDRAFWGEWANPLTLYRQLMDIFPEATLVARDQNAALIGYAVGLSNGYTREGWVFLGNTSQSYWPFGEVMILTFSPPAQKPIKKTFRTLPSNCMIRDISPWKPIYAKSVSIYWISSVLCPNSE